MMYRELLGIPSEHAFVRTDMKWDEGKKMDVDWFWYDEKDMNGDVIAKYVVKVIKFIYPPQKAEISYQKYSADSISLLASGELS